MTGLAPYLLFDGVTRQALEFYAEPFGGTPELHSYGEFGREDGPPDRISHGQLITPHLALYAADAGAGETAFSAQGIMLSLLGTAEPDTLHQWFDRLAEGGSVLEALEQRPWGASDGQVLDQFGVHWLIGYQAESDD